MNKTERIVAFIIVIIAVIIGGYIFFKQDKNNQEQLQRNALLEDQELKVYLNDLNEKVAQIEAKVYTQAEFKRFEKETLERIEKITGEVGEVSEYIKFKSNVRDTVFIQTDTTIYIVDRKGEQVERFPFSYNDKWMQLEGSVKPEGTEINYEYRPSYEIIASYKRPEGSGLFAKKRLLVDVKAENPKEVITEASAIEVQQPKVKFYDTKAFWASLSYIFGVITKLLLN